MTIATPLDALDAAHRAPRAERQHPTDADRGFSVTGEGAAPDIAAIQAASAYGVAAVPFAPTVPAAPAVGRVAATEAYQAQRDPRR